MRNRRALQRVLLHEKAGDNTSPRLGGERSRRFAAGEGFSLRHTNDTRFQQHTSICERNPHFRVRLTFGILNASSHLPGALTMSATVTPPEVVVVQCDASGEQPTAGVNLRFAWIAMLAAHLAAQHRDDADVFVVGDYLYPVESETKHRQASDVSVAFGCPEVKHDIYPQVVFDVLSPGWRYTEMQDKFAFYEKHGAEEYYILYPEFPMHADAFRRDGATLARVADVNGYVSPRTGLRFALETGQLTVFGRDGRPLRTAEELGAEREAAERTAREQRQRADAEAERATKLAAKLRELGVDPDTL